MRLSTFDLHTIADNEIRYRGIYFGNAERLLKQYSRSYPEMTETDAEYVADLIRGATITLPDIPRSEAY